MLNLNALKHVARMYGEYAHRSPLYDSCQPETFQTRHLPIQLMWRSPTVSFLFYEKFGKPHIQNSVHTLSNPSDDDVRRTYPLRKRGGPIQDKSKILCSFWQYPLAWYRGLWGELKSWDTGKALWSTFFQYRACSFSSIHSSSLNEFTTLLLVLA